jgi:beta-hydroxylase
MFDGTYIHQAENRAGVTRVILFCDSERPSSNSVLRWINRTSGRGMIRAAATQKVAGEHVGVLNHIFSYVYQLRALGLRIKEWNKSIGS